MPQWDQESVAPAVANLTDDNGDGLIDPNDIPDIVVVAFAGSNYHTDGMMYVLSGDDGRVHFSVSSPRFGPGCGVAIGDVEVGERVGRRRGSGAVRVEPELEAVQRDRGTRASWPTDSPVSSANSRTAVRWAEVWQTDQSSAGPSAGSVAPPGKTQTPAKADS